MNTIATTKTSITKDSHSRTLEDWRQRFNKAFDNIRQYGFDDTFKRLWNSYFCYCEGGFRERTISVVHIVATKPDDRL